MFMLYVFYILHACCCLASLQDMSQLFYLVNIKILLLFLLLFEMSLKEDLQSAFADVYILLKEAPLFRPFLMKHYKQGD